MPDYGPVNSAGQRIVLYDPEPAPSALRDDKINAVVASLRELTDEERLIVSSYFCSSCGREQEEHYSCQCWNDE